MRAVDPSLGILSTEVPKHVIALIPGIESILLVEDNAKVGDLTERVLQSAGKIAVVRKEQHTARVIIEPAYRDDACAHVAQ